MTERWEAIPGYDGMYDVSNQGRVRSWNNNGGFGTGRRKKPRILKASLCADGYPRVALSKESRATTLQVHMLVLTAFVGPCPAGMECRHLDGAPANNRLSNLAWGTHSENAQDSIAHGTHVDNRGEACGMSKLTEADVGEIRQLYAAGGVLQRELGEQFGVAPHTVSRIVHRKRWAHVSDL